MHILGNGTYTFANLNTVESGFMRLNPHSNDGTLIIQDVLIKQVIIKWVWLNF